MKEIVNIPEVDEQGNYDEYVVPFFFKVSHITVQRCHIQAKHLFSSWCLSWIKVGVGVLQAETKGNQNLVIDLIVYEFSRKSLKKVAIIIKMLP